MADVFISYHRPDEVFALGLYNSLRDAGVNPYIDKKRLEAGKDFDKQLFYELDQVKVIIIVIGDKTNTSEWVGKEVNYSLERQIDIVPIRIRKTSPLLQILGKKHQPIWEDEKFHAPFYRQIFELVGLIDQNRIFLNIKQQKADLRLLERLWEDVSTERINEIGDKLGRHNLEYKIWYETFYTYLEKRVSREYKFQSPSLEKTFLELEDAMLQFREEYRKCAHGMEWDGVRYMMAKYKLYDREEYPRDPQERMSTEEYQENIRQYKEAMDVYQTVLEKRNVVIEIIKSEYPEFNLFMDG